MNLTVACLMIKGKKKRAYTPEYVDLLRNMVARNLTIPHRFVCMTDTPELLPEGVEGIKVKRPRKVVPWWVKLKLFRPGMGWEGRILYIDLDVLIVGSLDEIATFPAPLALLPDMAPDFKGTDPTLKVIHKYNSSVIAFDAGVHPEIWTDWNPQTDPTRLRSDQDWIAERVPDAATFPREWFARLHPDTAPPSADPLKVLLCIKLKNMKARETLPWFGEYWK